jgi:DNA-binding beta-propeller fold protein YncE
VDEDLRFYTQRDERVAGPFSDDTIREAVRNGTLEAGTRVRIVGSDLWALPHAWATFSTRRSLQESPPAPRETSRELPPQLASATEMVRDMLLWCLHEGDITFGPLTGEQIRKGLASGRYRGATAALVGTEEWYPVGLLFDRAVRAAQPLIALAQQDSAHPHGAAGKGEWYASAGSAGQQLSMRCPTCLEIIAYGSSTCPECAEPTDEAALAARDSSARISSIRDSAPRYSIPDDQPNASWLQMHWRPLVTMGAMMALVCTGVGLRYLAPGRFQPESAVVRPAGAVPGGCTTTCWNGEACQKAACVWQSPSDVGHLAAEPAVTGPFALPKDVSDALPLDGERFAVALLTGMQIHNARSGEVLSLVSEAPQSRRLYRVNDVVYATAPQRVYVVDAATTRLLKTIELGATVGSVTVGASGRRALASLPGAHAVAVLATEFHAEIDRIQFGDDPVGPVGTDDTGKRALTTTGQIPLAGLRDPAGGAVYAFDPSRLASAQDRVRASVLGNPVSLLMTPDGEASYVVVRADSAIVPLVWQPSGAVVQQGRIPTCREPEQIELVRRGRRAIVRCNEGRAIEVFDLTTNKLIKHIAFESRAADLAIAPDGRQAVIALPKEGSGAVAIVDLDTYAVKLVPLSAEPTRVRLAPDGATALILSDRAKTAWVLR